MLKKKIAALGTAAVMIAGMCVPAMAASNDPNMTVFNNTPYTTIVEAGEDAKIAVAPADAYYSLSGYDNAADAAAGLTWTYNAGADLVDGQITQAAVQSDGKYGTQLTIPTADTAAGVISLHLMNAYNTSAYIDMTVVIEPETTAAAAEDVNIEVVDVHGDTFMYELGVDLDVEPAVNEAGNPFKGDASCAQKYATAGDALYSLMETGAISFTQAGGYVGTISDQYGNSLSGYSSPDWTYYYGWQYCVIRGEGADAEIVDDSLVVGAAAMPIESEDSVIWAFGTTDEAAEYFDYVLGMIQAGAWV